MHQSEPAKFWFDDRSAAEWMLSFTSRGSLKSKRKRQTSLSNTPLALWKTPYAEREGTRSSYLTSYNCCLNSYVILYFVIDLAQEPQTARQLWKNCCWTHSLSELCKELVQVHCRCRTEVNNSSPIHCTLLPFRVIKLWLVSNHSTPQFSPRANCNIPDPTPTFYC